MRHRRWLRQAVLLVCLGLAPGPNAGAAPSQAADAFCRTTVADAVNEIGDVIALEYFDPPLGQRLKELLQRRLVSGEYADATTADALARRVARELFDATGDKHLAVRENCAPKAAAADAADRTAAVRATNAGVQRVEILPEQIGYLNLTSFWRLEEARETLVRAMATLREARALVIDLRENGGGAPETVAFLAGFLFDEPNTPLFDIVPRQGASARYATPALPLPGRDGARTLYVLTSARSFSAGEGLAFLLQERGRALVIGEQTAGAANPGRPYHVPSGFDVVVPNGKVVSAVTHGNWEGNGVTPDVPVPAAQALETALRLARATLAR